MKFSIKTRLTALAMLAVATATLASCNSKEDPNTDYQTDTSVIVTRFYIKPNIAVMANLDSVFFSIDLNRGVIFNADSLPKGTDVTRLVPVINYPSKIKKASITMTGGKLREGTVDYKKNPSDSIDFSGKVVLTLTAEDGVVTRDYLLKVNVHRMDPDSLMWDRLAWSKLPSRLANPTDQRTLCKGDKAYALILEQDGTYTLSTTSDPDSGNWDKQSVTLPVGASVRSFTCSDTDFYLLADGKLYTSKDALTWTATPERWDTILGGYGSSVLGLSLKDGRYYHTIYPHDDSYIPAEVEEGFPVKGHSNFVTFTNKWSVEPIGFLTGGEEAGGLFTADTWGFDGDTWTSISVKTPPAMTGATIIPYFFYRQTSAMWLQTEMSVWLLVGGRLPGSKMNRTVYISYDNGVNWMKASDSVQLPDYFPALSQADAVVFTSPKSGSLEDNWTRMAPTAVPAGMRRITYETDGYDVAWQCPYIYYCGGRTAEGKLSNTLWRGVLNRLTFMPLL